MKKGTVKPLRNQLTVNQALSDVFLAKQPFIITELQLHKSLLHFNPDF